MKLRYEQGHIYDTHSKKKYNPKDKADMEILCNNINALLTENAIKIHKMEMQLLLIEQAVDIGKGDVE